ncbi:MAG: rhodanese-like domain-containing protein [Desulfovibrionaceae bacterium]|nr:rhodanese-like domain-containing protein [Desulfovibrionaceae bacterium]
MALCWACLIPGQGFGANDRPGWWTDAALKAEKDGYSLINAAELARLLDVDPPPILLDVRPDYEFAAGSLPGAVNLEFDLGDRSGLSPEKRARLGELLGPDTARTVVVFCRDFQCLRSGIAARGVARMGYLRVFRFIEGHRGWLGTASKDQDCGQDCSAPGQ